MRTPELSQFFQRFEGCFQGTLTNPPKPRVNSAGRVRPQLEDQYMVPELVYCFVFAGNDRSKGRLEVYALRKAGEAEQIPVTREWYQENRLWFFRQGNGFDAFVEYLEDHREPVYVDRRQPLIAFDLDLDESQESQAKVGLLA